MILGQNIVEWSQTAPWAEQRQDEQDLIISHALVEIFCDPFLASVLGVHRGTIFRDRVFSLLQSNAGLSNQDSSSGR